MENLHRIRLREAQFFGEQFSLLKTLQDEHMQDHHTLMIIHTQ